MGHYGFVPILAVLISVLVIVVPVVGIINFVSLRRLRRALNDMALRNQALDERVARLESQPAEPRVRPPEPEEIELTPAPPWEEKAEVATPRPRELPVAAPPEEGAVDAKDERRARFEEMVGKQWMTWAGVLALFIGAAFFLKHAFENQWIGPMGRVVLGILTGTVILVLGDYCLRRKMRALGQGLLGGALAILYVSLFAAFSLYKIIPQIPAFASMVIVTAAGVALAVLHNAVPLSFIAVLGGFLTPLMVSTGRNPRDALFGYLSVLDIGVLAVAFFKRWRSLDVLAFLGTWILFVGWFDRFYRDSAMAPTLIWVALFFLIFLIIPFVYQLRMAIASSVESFIMALANAAVAFGFAYWILRDDHQFVLGFVALAIAACYIAMAALARRRVSDDERTLFGFVALSMVFLTMAVPLHLKLHGITLTWAVEGPILLYLGYMYRYRPVRIAGFVVLVLAAIRLFWVHWPFHDDLYVLFLNRHFAAVMSVPLAAAVYALIHYKLRTDSTNVDRYLMIAGAICGGFLGLVVIHGEVGWWLWNQAVLYGINPKYLSVCGGSLVWALGAAGFLGGALRAGSRAAFYSGLAALFVAVILLLVSYVHPRYVDYWLFVNARFACGLIVALVAFGYAFVANGYGNLFSEKIPRLVTALFVVAGILPLALLSAETYTYCYETIAGRRRARWSARMSVSIVWSLYALSALAIGFWRRVREVRLAALGLLALTAIKLILFDMARVEQIYRIVSFVLLGLMMIAASYLYHKLEMRLAKDSGESS